MTKTVEMVITGAQVLNVYTREFEATSLWIDHGRIISNLRDEPYIAAQHVDATGRWIVPGMIDAHVHMESSVVAPSELGKVLLQHERHDELRLIHMNLPMLRVLLAFST